MGVTFNRAVYFDSVRDSLFGGSMTQQQVDGQEAILTRWEGNPPGTDLRWLAYSLATTKHETASTMWPIEEYGKGQGSSYGQKDPETGQTYYGRGYVQLTWRDNYAKATRELGLTGGPDDLEWHADKALDPDIAADVMFRGMDEAWFRPPNNYAKWFNASTNDPYQAREIINGDKHIVPSWSGGVSIGNLIKGYHYSFLSALQKAASAAPEPPLPEVATVTITVVAPADVNVVVKRIER